MAGDELRHAAQQEALQAARAVRAEDDEIGAPLGGGVEDALADVAHLDGGLCLEAAARNCLATRSTSSWAGFFMSANSGA